MKYFTLPLHVSYRMERSQYSIGGLQCIPENDTLNIAYIPICGNLLLIRQRKRLDARKKIKVSSHKDIRLLNNA